MLAFTRFAIPLLALTLSIAALPFDSPMYRPTHEVGESCSRYEEADYLSDQSYESDHEKQAQAANNDSSDDDKDPKDPIWTLPRYYGLTLQGDVVPSLYADGQLDIVYHTLVPKVQGTIKNAQMDTNGRYTGCLNYDVHNDFIRFEAMKHISRVNKKGGGSVYSVEDKRLYVNHSKSVSQALEDFYKGLSPVLRKVKDEEDEKLFLLSLTNVAPTASELGGHTSDDSDQDGDA